MNQGSRISYQGRNRRTVNYLKAMYFDYPEWVPCQAGILPAVWMKYREGLEEVVLAHPRLFPGYKKGSKDFDRLESPFYRLGRRTDCWGTVWENVEPGMDSIDVGYPLADWSALEGYRPPDPMTEDTLGPRDWEGVKQALDAAKKRGGLATGGLAHGFMYMRLFYLRGFENLMLDVATEDPRLRRVIAMVENYNAALIREHLRLGAEFITCGDDLGMQRSLPMSPAAWRRWIKPSYDRLFRPCREAGVPVYLHTDGHVLEILHDLIEVGVRVVNTQIRANGLAGLQAMARGKVALDQDLDRQLFPFASRSEVEEHVGEVFDGLYLPQGGLMIKAEIGPDVPLGHIDAICTTLERLCHLPEPEKTD